MAYKNVDRETFDYIDAVSKAMIKRSHEIKKAGGIAGQTVRISLKSLKKSPSRRISEEVRDDHQNGFDSTVSELGESMHVDEQSEVEPENISSSASALAPISDESGSESGRVCNPRGPYPPTVVSSGSFEPVACRSLEEMIRGDELPESLNQVDISDHDILRMWLVN